ncbi:Os04g0410250 [Oryza sativa Japonica Group]|uniref:Os04g0410250 protein n=1 Tax=Oryza sativa subsp. japonica TaxID=39947 RepID=A0A0N7KJ09_ORYSJ|nr:Os04g0410250 [Oryza sativa Japonica Group]
MSLAKTTHHVTRSAPVITPAMLPRQDNAPLTLRATRALSSASLSYSSAALQLNPSPVAAATAVLLPGPVMPLLDPGKLPLWSPNCRQPLVLT